MPFISLRESLSRAKDKWKIRFRTGISNPTVPLIQDTSATLADEFQDAMHPPEYFGPSASPRSKHVQSPSPPQSDNTPQTGNRAWSGIKTLLAVLESSAEAFGPLKSAIGGLNKCLTVYESASKGRKDYAELYDRLDKLLGDLAEHIVGAQGWEMTNSVRQLCRGIEAELKHVEEKQRQNRVEELASALGVSDEIHDCYRRVHVYIERLTLNVNMTMLRDIDKLKTESRLASISPSKAAVYNSTESDEVKRGGCTPGTREPQIALLLKWAGNPDTGRTCWMNGMAGTGKTTIAYTVCTKLNKASKLGASFFCSRVIPECRQVKHIIPSISYQLARFSLPFRCALIRILEADPDAHAQSLKDQYQKLIVDPLSSVKDSLPTDFIVVIDALDECENEDGVGQILGLLLSTPSTLPIRFLISSRPEPGITQPLMAQFSEEAEALLVLHDLDSDSVQADIETYMRQELEFVSLKDDQWAGLLERCGILFIYASTTCRYIKQAYALKIVDEAVNTIIGSGSAPVKQGNEKSIDQLYFTILTAAFKKFEEVPEINSRIQALLETVVCAMEAMTLSALAGLLSFENADQVDALIKPLRSVLHVSKTAGLVSTLHASFPDFMLSEERSRSFFCNSAKRHTEMAKACLRRFDAVEPKFNICGLSSSFLLDDQVENMNQRVDQKVSPELAYSCRHWPTHLSFGQYGDELIDVVRKFFSTQLLLWMEILNLTGHMRYGTSIVREAETWCLKQGVPDDIAQLARDSWQFVSVYANHPVSRSTPHIYISMLPFWPKSRPISRAYMPRTFGMIQATGTAITRRQLSLLATWKVPGGSTYSMSLSSDGTRLATRTDYTIEILDTSTGDNILSLRFEHRVLSITISPNISQVIFCCDNSFIYLWDTRHGDKVTELLSAHVPDVRSAAFSPDSSHVAFGSSNGDVYICSLKEKEPFLGPLKGHTDTVLSFAFSPDGSYLAFGSEDNTIRIWDAVTGKVVGNPLRGHTGRVLSVSYSPDGSHLASSSADKTIRVWDPQSGQTLLEPLDGHSDWVGSVAFSPDGRFIGSGSDDQTIRVYDSETGQTVLGPLHGHTLWVNSVIFSPDSARLFSCSPDGTIRTWNVQDIHVPDVPQNPPSLSSAILSVRYSHSGSRIVSGSEDGTIHIWDVRTRQLVLGPLHGHTDRIWSIDFSPNDAYIASASDNGTLRIWDAANGDDLHGPMEGHGGAVNSVRFLQDSSVVASGSSNGTVRIWDVMSGQLVAKLLEESDDEENRDGIRSVGFSPDGHRLVCGSSKGILQVLDRHTGQTLVGPLQAHQRWVSSVEFSPDGSRILSASYDNSIRIWDGQTGQQILGPSEHSLKHDGDVNSASFSPDDRFIVSGSDDRTVRVWDAQSGDLVFGPLEGHTDLVQSVQFSPDGSHVVSCSWDRTIRFWDVSSCRTMTQKSQGQDDGKMGGSNQSTDKGYGLWTLDKDGWVLDEQKRRLVWVPSDLQGSLIRAYNDSVIPDKPWVKLELDGAKLGEEWSECYRP